MGNEWEDVFNLRGAAGTFVGIYVCLKRDFLAEMLDLAIVQKEHLPVAAIPGANHGSPNRRNGRCNCSSPTVLSCSSAS